MSSTFTGLLRTLKSTSSARESMLLSSCENELTELMHQIDVMVENKRAEWQHQIQGIQLQCERKEREMTKLKETLEFRNKEVGQLQQRIEIEEDSHKKMISKYESQLGKLKLEMDNLKRNYAKLQRNSSRQAADVDKITEQLSTEKERANQEVEKAILKTKELEGQLRDLEMTIEVQNTKLKGFEDQRRSFVEKSELMQNQLLSYQGQLNRKKQLLDSLEQKHVSKTAELENEILRYKDEFEVQEETIRSLKKSLQDTRLKDEKSRKENIQICEELEILKNKVQKKDTKISSLENSIQNLQKHIKKQELEWSKSFEMQASEESEIIKNLQREKSSHEELLLNKSKEQQKRIIRLQNECIRLQKEATDKGSQAPLQGMQSQDVLKLQNLLNHRDEKHAAEIAGMKNQVASLIQELHKRDTALAEVSERAGKMEEEFRDVNSKHDKKEAELQVSNAQLEALRLENRHLRDASVDDHLSTTADLRMFETHIAEIENANARVIARLEDENSHLKNEIVTIRDEQDRLTAINFELSAKETTPAEIDVSQQRQIKDADDTNERINSLQEQLNETIKSYEEKLHELQSQSKSLKEEELHELQSQSKSLKEEELRESNEPDLSRFVERTVLDDDGTNSPQNSTKKENSDLEETDLTRFFDMLGDASFTGGNSRRSSVTREFNSEEDRREKELQQLLEARISDLEQRTNVTIKKYQL